jgi:hypothetical protein
MAYTPLHAGLNRNIAAKDTFLVASMGPLADIVELYEFI